MPRADFCDAALSAIEDKYKFIKLLDGDAWFPNQLVGEKDVETALLELAPSSRETENKTGAYTIANGAGPIAVASDGAPILPHGLCAMQRGYPVALAVPFGGFAQPPQVNSQPPPRIGAPLEEFDGVADDDSNDQGAAYERQRQENILSNKRELERLGIGDPPPPPKRTRTPADAGKKPPKETAAASRPRREPPPVRSEPVRSLHAVCLSLCHPSRSAAACAL